MSAAAAQLVAGAPRALRRALQLGVLATLIPPALDAAELRTQPLDCVIEPSMLVSVGSEAGGVIASVNVDRGDLVEQGQLLATLDDNLERASSNLYRARANNDVTVRWSEVKRGFGRRSADRIRRLQRASVASEQEVDQAVTDENLTALKLEEAKVNRRLARLEFERAEAALAQRRLVSPVRALVVERLMHPGERVTDQPILSLAAIDVLHVEVIVPVAMHGRLTVGQTARVVPEQPVGGEYEATIRVVDKVMDARSGTFGVRLALPNPDHALPAGLRCTVSFAIEPVIAGKNETPHTRKVEPAPVVASPGATNDVVAVPEPDVARRREEQLAGRTLPRLRPSGAPEQAPSAPSAAAAGAADRVCLALGGFETRAQASDTVKVMAADGVAASIRAVDSGSPKGYLLLVSAHGDPDRVMATLRAKGLQDIQLLRSGPHAGHLSVGYFLRPEAAQVQRARLLKKGIDAVMTPRGGARRFWVDLRLGDETARDRLARRLRATHERLVTEPRECTGTLSASL